MINTQQQPEYFFLKALNAGRPELDPIEFHSGEEPYKERIDFYQRKTGLIEAVQIGTGQLNGTLNFTKYVSR